MRKEAGFLGGFALGIPIGFLVFFLAFWWIGTISLSIGIALIVCGGIFIATLFTHELIDRRG